MGAESDPDVGKGFGVREGQGRRAVDEPGGRQEETSLPTLNARQSTRIRDELSEPISHALGHRCIADMPCPQGDAEQGNGIGRETSRRAGDAVWTAREPEQTLT
jgi:hypothetical protein